MKQEDELQTLAHELVDEYYETQGRGILNNLNKRSYENLSSDRNSILLSMRENLANYHEAGKDLTEEQKDAVISIIEKEIWGYGVIDDLIHDPLISDIKIHNAHSIRIKREGKREGCNLSFGSEHAYEQFVTRLLERNKVNLGTANALQTFTDDSQDDFILRLSVISGLLIVGGSTCVVIRKIPRNKYSLKELEALGMFERKTITDLTEDEIKEFFISEDKPELDVLLHRMIAGRGIIFCGKGASGKTTLMNACIEKIPETESIFIAQENAELFDNHHPDLIAAHVMVNGGDSKVSYTLGDLTRMALLVDLDRVIVGEIKEGSEAAGLSKASMTGHKCWTSVHGESCEMALEKMADYISQATGYGNKEVLKQLMGFEYVVHLSDFRVDEIKRIESFDYRKGKLNLVRVYPFEEDV